VAGDLALFATPRARALVLIATALLVFVRLGATDLWPPDEPRYALVAEEMRTMEHGASGLVLLHLHGTPYTQKPPLFYWLAAAAGAPLGRVTEFAARLPSAIAGLATVAATIAIGTLLFGRGAGTLAGLLLATTFDWSYRARTVQLDTLLALFETTAILAFWRIEAARRAAPGPPGHQASRAAPGPPGHQASRAAPGPPDREALGARRRNLVWMHVSLGLAVLAKGPVGWIIPLLAITAYLAWERRLRDVLGLLPLWGLAISLLPGVVWIASAVALGPPGFFHDAVVDNLFGRAVTGTSHAQPFLYYFEKFPPDLLPWLLLLPVTIWSARRTLAADAAPDERRAWRFLLAWIATSFLFFSLASGKRLRYLLTIEPAFALLFAATLRVWLPSSLRAPRVLAIAGSVLGVGLLVGAGALVGTNRLADAALARGIAVALVATVAIGTATWIVLARRGAAVETRIAVLAAGVFAVQFLSYAVAVPAFDVENSPRPIAETAAALARPGEPIGLYRGHDIANAVTYYEGRPTLKLEDPAELGGFLAGGGRVIVFEEEQLAKVESVARVIVRGRFRVRGETWLIAVRSAPTS
jgi:4-amino-4-deoxy-L-arabinose transferase-like glycosyltransferase